MKYILEVFLRAYRRRKGRYEDKMKIVGCAKDLYCCLESKSDAAQAAGESALCGTD